MNVKVADLMIKSVIKCQLHNSIEHVRNIMQKNKVHAVPIVDTDDTLKGIVSSLDLTDSLKDNSPISSVMTEKVYTIPMYNDIHHAARLMRNRRVHHVVVTHEKKVVGMLSSFDLLRLVEKHRFEIKPAPSKATRKKSQRD